MIESRVSVFIDAEDVRLQPAVRAITLAAMKRFNAGTKTKKVKCEGFKEESPANNREGGRERGKSSRLKGSFFTKIMEK